MDLETHGREHVASAAHLALAQWWARLGGHGAAALRVLPGLAAEVDQHIAEVREQLTDGRGGGLHPVTLAAYADGVADVATRRGWSPLHTPADGWARAPWPSVRLLAVCLLAGAPA
ncbi:DUF6401 family natural product biosynthesis protein [Nucisporomicrobium flavum]|uniref:DUF6401 family natural product biosynthesis protein n=1 Tax=Nucisporomicrobium flavum TaxID=2785915 RepID=UPI001F4894AF|nr:DUF6401 family natural product biosynthesis protein [Nucisporomicrobium flavum]